jgi:Domain of unknown function (DUF4349)
MTTAEILAELRATRPAAPTTLRTRIDAIAMSEPPRRAAVWTMPRLLGRRRTLLVALPATALLAFASAGAIGLVSSGGRDADVVATGSAPGDARSVEERAAKTAGGETATAPSVGAGDAVAPGPATDRAQRVSATLTIEVPDNDALSSATQDALDATRALGGYVVSVSYATAEDGTASLLVRVPTESVQDAITRLSSLGTIVSQQVQIDDLQEQIDALGRKIAELRTRIARITAQLADPDLPAAQRATLTARRAAARDELAALSATRTARTSEAKLATLQLTLVTERGAAVPAVPSRIDRTLDEAGRILAWEAAIVLFTLVIVGPLAVLSAAGWVGYRALARRADERLLEAS